ncbi:hypothetical protein AM500_13530 [Bacillus sp. FJAT-18017]|uniref:hypothetical protein n=1 Tax=Bacillus sp. FJAT-18017 TaxID=1705566 RepID=UPI0006AFA5B1|nr:hypothetical protein [Bacillus sp. FJAT-18017]ALC90691.1 hypothetical protein AM500_13530 [Bacillus sp. FJAT-18017]
MDKNEELTLEAKQLLKPITYRPSLEPRKAFVNELHYKLLNTKRKKRLHVKPIAAFCLTTLLLIVVLLSYSNKSDLDLAAVPEKPFLIESVSSLKQVQTLEYGSEQGQAGLYFMGTDETLPVTVTSFDIEDGTFYLLDEARRQVLVVGNNGSKKSFPLKGESNTTGTLTDILVTPDNQIYILNTASPVVVYQYTEEGNLVETFDLSKHQLFFPNELGFFENIGVVVSQNQEQVLSLKTGEMLEENALPYQFATTHQKQAVLTINDGEIPTKLDIHYDEGKGPSSIESVRDEQIVFTKTEVPRVFSPITETHVYSLDKQGETIGGIRIPTENFIEIPQTIESYIKADKNKLYLLSPEKEHIAIYELTLGKSYESYLQEQVAKAEVGFDYKTFGKPFPELEAEIKKLFADGKIFSQYGDETSVNGAAIDNEGTVILDFKEFFSGSPSSYQAQEISNALNQAIFVKFPEVKQVYLQFDGSFSAWCVWMQTTEEPWKRP